MASESLGALLLLLSLSLCGGLDFHKRENKPEAFVTILYGSGFELGVRVLGQSIRESGTELEYVVMCTRDVPQDTIAVLKKDGWKVKMIDPFNAGTAKFDGSIHKMRMWTLTEYRRILWVDADAVLVQNIDHLTRCGNFCATYRHSDLFNAGIMVVKPSLVELNRIMTLSSHYLELPDTDKASSVALPSGRNIWGDQNLLNEFYNTVYGLKYAKLFDKNDPNNHEEPMRLPEGYNSDYAWYIWYGTWTVKDKDRYIVHYTAGPLKPHSWWTYPICDANWIWYGFRQRLPSRYNDPSIWHLFNWIPLLVVSLLFLGVRFVPCLPHLTSHCRKLVVYISPEQDNWFMFSFPTLVLFLSYYFAFKQVPTLMWPGEAWVVFGMWTIMFLCTFFIPFCYVFYTTTALSLRGIHTRIILEILLYFVIFVLLHLLMLWVVYLVSPFTRRFLAFLLLFFGIIVYFHFAAKRMVRICYHHNSSNHTRNDTL